MRLSLLAAIGGFMVAGCGSDPVSETQPVIKEVVAAVAPPDFSQTTPLALSEDGVKIQVGDSVASFETKFPKPPKAIRVELPPKFSGGYSARGWEMNDGSQGIGAVAYEGRIAAVLRQLSRSSEADVQQVIAAYARSFADPAVVVGATARYWFWERQSQLLMVCAYQPGGQNLSLTTALGDKGVLRELGISQDLASRDIETLRGIFVRGQGLTN